MCSCLELREEPLGDVADRVQAQAVNVILRNHVVDPLKEVPSPANTCVTK